MKSLRLRYLLLAGLLALPTLAHAHPGHDGDHEFVWDFEHVASHPLVTLAYIAVGGVAGWLAWRLIQPKSPGAARSKSDRRR